MEITNLYDFMFKRKSVRKYDMSSLDKITLQEVSDYIKNVQPLMDDIKVETKIVTQESVKSLLPITAPYYILIYSELKEGYLTNAGFMFQQVDLFLSANGLGSCWVGMVKPKKELNENSDLEYVIALAFGKPSEPLYRNSISEFKRKSIEEISNLNQKDSIIESARLAPSATNSQPWYYQVSENEIKVFCKKAGLLKAFMYEKMNRVDMGIAICHLMIALDHEGKKVEITLNQNASISAPEGYYYIATIKIK